MDLGLRGQTAVVFGGANGIGRAIATEFAAEGASVAIFDRDERSGAIADEIAASRGVPAHGAKIDVTDYAAVKSAVDDLARQWNRVDHVVIAAGIGSGKFGFPYWNLEPSDWPRVWEVNVQGTVNVAHAMAPIFAQARRGTMLFLSSVAAQMGSQTDPPYSAAKAALLNFMQCAAKDLAPYNVRVNALCPGMVRTDLNRAVWQSWADRQAPDQRLTYDEWAGAKVKNVAPLGRWQTPEDLAAMAVFVASSRAENITGQALNVDGGQVMG